MKKILLACAVVALVLSTVLYMGNTAQAKSSDLQIKKLRNLSSDNGHVLVVLTNGQSGWVKTNERIFAMFAAAKLTNKEKSLRFTYTRHNASARKGEGVFTGVKVELP